MKKEKNFKGVDSDDLRKKILIAFEDKLQKVDKKSEVWALHCVIKYAWGLWVFLTWDTQKDYFCVFKYFKKIWKDVDCLWSYLSS